MRLRPTALSAVSLLVLGACADPSAPESARTSGVPSLKRAPASQEGGLPLLASARSNKVEPKHVDQGRFNIALDFLVEPTAAQRTVFETAAARWERIIIKDVPSISGTLPSCFVGLPPVSTDVVDDIVIEVVLQPIDGPGGILGQAGPCFIRNADALPVSGVMYFDSEDLAFLEGLALFDEVIVHEMGHVLGIGTLWNFRRALRQGAPTDPYFSGRYANIHWGAEGGDDLLPVENIGGPGTRFSHWRESVLRNELMTGFLNLGDNPLSRITAGSLRDLGYGVGIVGEQYALERGAPGVDPSTAATTAGDGVSIAEREVLLAPIGIVPE